MTNPIDWLAQRVETDPFFLASILAIYAQSEHLDEAGLAAALGCRMESLSRLRLCRPPHSDHFWDDVKAIAAHCQVDPERLVAVVRRGEVIQRLQAPAPPSRTLLAARDRTDEPTSDEGKAP